MLAVEFSSEMKVRMFSRKTCPNMTETQPAAVIRHRLIQVNDGDTSPQTKTWRQDLHAPLGCGRRESSG